MDFRATRANAYRTDVTIQPGRRGTASMTVTKADLSIAFGSGQVPALATPRMVALLEEATLVALVGALEPGQTSVGMRIHVDHLAPSALGSEVVAHVELDQVDGQRLAFSGEARGEGADGPLLASATIIRVVVDTEAFLGRLHSADGTDSTNP